MTKLKDEKMCACCGTTAEDCTCSPNCKGCDCNRDKVSEGLADLADMAERDHEVQMARADLYKIAKYAIKLHDMLKNVSEAEGIEGWQQAKITKAADYIGSVYHALDYDMSSMGQEMPESIKTKRHKPVWKEEQFKSYKGALAEKLQTKKKVSESSSVCPDCGNPSWTTLNMTREQIEEGEQHGNSKIYKKCWKGYEKVPGKTRGEKGSCRKK